MSDKQDKKIGGKVGLLLCINSRYVSICVFHIYHNVIIRVITMITTRNERDGKERYKEVVSRVEEMSKE